MRRTGETSLARLVCAALWSSLVLVAALVSSARAGTCARMPSVEMLTGQIVGEPSPRTPGLGFEIEVHTAIPAPAADIGTIDIGMRAGASVLWRQDARTAMGLDACYHYWPMSSRFKQAYNQRFRNALLGTVELGDGSWRMTARSATGFVRVTPWPSSALRPWFKLGGGLFQLDRRLKPFSGDAGFFSITMTDLPIENDIGVTGALGLDFASGSRLRWGIELNVDHVAMKPPIGRGLTVLAVGVHAVFGRR